VAGYSDDRENKRYNKRLPDPVFSFLTLRHVVFAADTYWGMISEIHNILGTDMKEFHEHYSLKPWLITSLIVGGRGNRSRTKIGSRGIDFGLADVPDPKDAG
jgi:hypothetical protein